MTDSNVRRRHAILEDPVYWQKRAEDMRSILNEIDDRQSRTIIPRVAADYNRLADRAAQQLLDKGDAANEEAASPPATVLTGRRGYLRVAS
jgi:hypothetical protein